MCIFTRIVVEIISCDINERARKRKRVYNDGIGIFSFDYFFTLQGEKGAKGDPGPMGLPVRIFLSRLGL